MGTFAENTWFTTVSCCSCGVLFAVTNEFERRRREDRQWFYCPSGHMQHYTGETEASKLKRELERARQMNEAAQARAAKAETERQQIAKAHRKMRVRVMNGVCPCCNRTFPNLMAHIKTKHPEFRATDNLKALREAFGMGQAAVAKEAGVPTPYVSAYENQRYLPEYAKVKLDNWLSRHEATAPLSPDTREG